MGFDTQKSYRPAGCLELPFTSQASARQPWSTKLPSRSTRTASGRPNFRSRTAGGHGHLHYNISSTTYSTVYSIPADPELDLTGLLDTVPDLAKQAISGGGFLGDIDEIADTYDVRTVVEDLAKQKFLSSALSVPRLSGVQEDRRLDYGEEDKIKAYRADQRHRGRIGRSPGDQDSGLPTKWGSSPTPLTHRRLPPGGKSSAVADRLDKPDRHLRREFYGINVETSATTTFRSRRSTVSCRAIISYMRVCRATSAGVAV